MKVTVVFSNLPKGKVVGKHLHFSELFAPDTSGGARNSFNLSFWGPKAVIKTLALLKTVFKDKLVSEFSVSIDWDKKQEKKKKKK